MEQGSGTVIRRCAAGELVDVDVILLAVVPFVAGVGDGDSVALGGLVGGDVLGVGFDTADVVGGVLVG